jgi:MFS superfamily sulfate permease-like transporter
VTTGLFQLVRDGLGRAGWRGDIVAGVTVAAIAIPESLGYARIVGLPVQTGLYCALLPAVVFAFLASSRQLVVGADSATAALVAAGAGAVAASSSPEYAGAVAVLGLVTAAFLLVMAGARLGFLADLISAPVLAGFLSGVGVSLIIGKLPGVLGIEASGTTWQKLQATITGLDDINWASAVLGAGVVATMVFGGRVAPKVPAALLALVLFSVVGVLLDAEDRGVAMVGALPPGLPSFALPTIESGEMARLAASAAAIAVVVLAQSAAVARSFAAKHGERVDTNADLIGLAGANAASAVTGGFAINGSPPRTAAGDAAGGRSQRVNLVMAGVIALLLLVGSGVFAYVPSPVLDGIVLGIGIHLLKIPELRQVRAVRRVEWWIAMLALVVVAFVGVEQGVLLAVAVSIVDRARRQYHPSEQVLTPGGAPVPGVLVYRFGAELFFANASYFDERIADLRAAAPDPVRAVVLDGSAMTDVDVTGTDSLRRLAEDLRAHGGRLVLTGVSADARACIEAAGLTELATIAESMDEAMRLATAPGVPDER